MRRVVPGVLLLDRRDFMKMTAASAAALGMRPLAWAAASAEAASKPAVVWLEGQDCAGCTESVLAALEPALKQVILDDLCIRYHETIMAGSGETADAALNAAIQAGGFVLVVEGSLPAGDPRYLQVAGRPLEQTLIEAAGAASLVVAVGACASFGGIPRAAPTQGQGVQYFLDKHAVGTPIINLPGCPVHPVWFFDTIYGYIESGGLLPQLDEHRRPLLHFGERVHRLCPRRHNFRAERYLTDWNDPQQLDYCLLLKGCKGTVTYADCPQILWNANANSCTTNNAPCAGCTEPKFYDRLSPLFQQTFGRPR